MSPKNIVINAQRAGLDVIAITDHNMVENGFYAHELAKKTGTAVLFGMELQTREEIHLLIIFDDYKAASGFQKKVYNLLPEVENDPSYFGDQVVVDCDDNIVRFEKKRLLNSAQISLNDAVLLAKQMGALVISSHIDSPNFSIISQLGYVPEDLPLDALEVRKKENIPHILPFIMNKGIPFVTFSDAHYIDDIGKRVTVLPLNEPNVAEIAKALKTMDNMGIPDDG
jgi:PHP family Zn ribbon phosphoesterase